MTTRFCGDCGTPHDCATRADDAVTIARIEADRDIQLAKINARAGVQAAELRADADAAFDAGEAAGVLETVDALAGNGDGAEPDGADGADGAPIVVDTAADAAEPDIAAEPDTAPPVVVDVPSVSDGRGYWDMYKR